GTECNESQKSPQPPKHLVLNSLHAKKPRPEPNATISLVYYFCHSSGIADKLTVTLPFCPLLSSQISAAPPGFDAGQRPITPNENPRTVPLCHKLPATAEHAAILALYLGPRPLTLFPPKIQLSKSPDTR